MSSITLIGPPPILETGGRGPEWTGVFGFDDRFTDTERSLITDVLSLTGSPATVDAYQNDKRAEAIALGSYGDIEFAVYDAVERIRPVLGQLNPKLVEVRFISIDDAEKILKGGEITNHNVTKMALGFLERIHNHG